MIKTFQNIALALVVLVILPWKTWADYKGNKTESKK
jgi:hypothetical protein